MAEQKELTIKEVNRRLELWRELSNRYLAHPKFHDSSFSQKIRELLTKKRPPKREELRIWEELGRQALPTIRTAEACTSGKNSIRRAQMLLGQAATFSITMRVRIEHVKLVTSLDYEDHENYLVTVRTQDGQVIAQDLPAHTISVNAED